MKRIGMNSALKLAAIIAAGCLLHSCVGVKMEDFKVGPPSCQTCCCHVLLGVEHTSRTTIFAAQGRTAITSSHMPNKMQLMPTGLMLYLTGKPRPLLRC